MAYDVDDRGYVTVAVPDGTSMRAFVARPEPSEAPGRHPGLLVLQEAFGVNEHIRDLAARFAAQAYVAVASELFHRTEPGTLPPPEVGACFRTAGLTRASA